MKKFTLVEILVAIAVVAILVGMTVGVTSFVRDKMNRSSTQATIKLIEMAFAKYKNDFGTYPHAALGTDPRDLYLDEVTFSSANTDKLKQTLWGYFNDVVAEQGRAKIRGVPLKLESDKYYVLDGWGHKIIYIYPGVFNTETFDLISLGQDKVIGTSSGGFSTNRSDYSTAGEVDDVTNFTRN